MSTDLNLFSEDGDDESPFDAIRRIRLDGTEFWSARDLMPLLDYPRWQDFTPVVSRAITSADAQGLNRHDLFRVNPEKTGGRPREDFELVRFVCYLVAMNGDPRKPAVAAAQAYFAIRTREAEVAPKSLALTEDEIVAQALAITTRKVEALTERVAVLEPKAIVADKILKDYGVQR